MKSIRNIFGIKESKRTIKSFSSRLSKNAMIMTRGGEGDPNDMDTWSPPPPPPPPTTTLV